MDTGLSFETIKGFEDSNESLRLFSKFLNIYFFPFLSLAIITGQQSFSSLADGLIDITQRQK